MVLKQEIPSPSPSPSLPFGIILAVLAEILASLELSSLVIKFIVTESRILPLVILASNIQEKLQIL